MRLRSYRVEWAFDIVAWQICAFSSRHMSGRVGLSTYARSVRI
jgi:hypothetical protein